MDHGLGSDPYPSIHTPDPYPQYMNRLTMSWRKPTSVFLTLTDHFPCRAGFSYASGEYIHIYIYMYTYAFSDHVCYDCSYDYFYYYYYYYNYYYYYYYYYYY